MSTITPCTLAGPDVPGVCQGLFFNTLLLMSAQAGVGRKSFAGCGGWLLSSQCRIIEPFEDDEGIRIGRHRPFSRAHAIIVHDLPPGFPATNPTNGWNSIAI